MNIATAPSLKTPTRRAHELRRLAEWRVEARRWLRDAGADHTSLCELDAMVQRLRTQLWRGGRAGTGAALAD